MLARHWRANAGRWTVAKPLAKSHRREATPAENVLCQALRGGQLSGYRFRRQHAIDRFIVDFYCKQASVVIEVDGPIHLRTPVEDAQRRRILESQDLVLVRFTNEDVLERLDDVIRQIRQKLPAPVRLNSDLPLSANGEGAGG